MLRLLSYLLTHIFFRRITITGTPYKGKSSLWASNHPNGIVDPALMIAIAPVLLHPLAKATLWKNPVMRVFLKITGAIPVARTQDIEEMFEGGQIDPNWKKNVNANAFEQVNKVLMEGGNVLIFPEGVGHDDPFLHPMKTGVARMALQAVSPQTSPRGTPSMASRPLNTVVIQPVVINYTEKNEFRSELYVHYCEQIEVHATDTVPDLMNKIFQSIEKYYVPFKTWDEKRNWQYIFRIFYGRFAVSLDEFHDFVAKNGEKIESDAVLFGKIQTMRCMLQASDLSPCDKCWRNAAQGKTDHFWFFMFLLRIFSFVFIILPVMFLDTLIWGIPLELCELLGTSKNKPRDIYATMKIAHAMWIFPLWSSFVVGTITVLTQNHFPSLHPILLWWIYFISAPLILFLGFLVSERFNFCAGYFRFGLLKLTFPRGLEEVLQEWKEIANAVVKKVNG